MVNVYRNKILELMEERLLDSNELAKQLVCWLSEADAKEFWFANGYQEFEPEENEEDE